MNASRKARHVFKGYPLRDFVHPQGFSLDHILRTTSLKAEIERHIKGFAVDGNAADSCGKTPPRRPPVSRPPVGPRAPDRPTGQTFQEQLEQFLDGLYLGCFESGVVQKDPRRPPQNYVYDIGFNTDKLTGFIVANPYDTLLTFGPRGRQVPYTVADPGVVRMPKFPNIKVADVPIPQPSGSRDPRRIQANALVTHFGMRGAGSEADPSPPRASIVCDLNLRIMVNHRRELQLLSIYGDTLKVHLSRGLVEPVVPSSTSKWAKTGRRLQLDVGSRVLTFRRNRLPTWGGPIDLGGATVSITSSNLFGRLQQVDIGGTQAKPLILFEGVEILG